MAPLAWRIFSRCILEAHNDAQIPATPRSHNQHAAESTRSPATLPAAAGAQGQVHSGDGLNGPASQVGAN